MTAVDVCLLMMLLGLCGCGSSTESTELSTKQTTPDIWAEMRALRDIVVELNLLVKQLQGQNTDLQTRLSSSETELLLSKSRIEQLETENAVQAADLKSLETRLTANESKTSVLEKENADLQTRLSSSETEPLLSKSRIEQLETENTVQAAELKSLETRLTATESKTSDLEKENADLQTRLISSKTELLLSKSRIDQLETENTVQAAELKSLDTRLTATESKTSVLEKENAEKLKVAFYTGLTDSGHFGRFRLNDTLRFRKVFTNVGNAYNPATGFFTAPVRGVYYIQFTLCGKDTGSMGVFVYKNNQSIMYLKEGKLRKGLQYITKSAVLELMAGDEIHLVLPSDYSLYDDVNNHSTFSGALLFTL